MGLGHAAKVAQYRRNKCRRSVEVVMDETITNLNPLTPLPILRLFQPAGTLDALANCKSLTSVDVSYCLDLRGPCPRPAASKSLT